MEKNRTVSETPRLPAAKTSSALPKRSRRGATLPVRATRTLPLPFSASHRLRVREKTRGVHVACPPRRKGGTSPVASAPREATRVSLPRISRQNCGVTNVGNATIPRSFRNRGVGRLGEEPHCLRNSKTPGSESNFRPAETVAIHPAHGYGGQASAPPRFWQRGRCPSRSPRLAALRENQLAGSRVQHYSRDGARPSRFSVGKTIPLKRDRSVASLIW